MNTRHIQRTARKTKSGVVYEETNVYLPKSKEEKLKIMGEDYRFNKDYKKTYKKGSVAFAQDDGKTTGQIFEAGYGQRARGRWFVPYDKQDKSRVRKGRR